MPYTSRKTRTGPKVITWSGKMVAIRLAESSSSLALPTCKASIDKLRTKNGMRTHRK